MTTKRNKENLDNSQSKISGMAQNKESFNLEKAKPVQKELAV